MEMPEFNKYRYLVVKNDDDVRFDVWSILPKGRLAAADQAEFSSLAGILERVEDRFFPSLPYQTRISGHRTQ